MDNPPVVADTLVLVKYHYRLRAWWLPTISGPRFVVPIPDVGYGVWLLQVLAEYDRFRSNGSADDDSWAVGGIQELVNSEWIDFDLNADAA